MAMENALFSKYLVSLINLVDHACNVGMLGKVRDGGEECGSVKDNRYITKGGHLVAINL